MFKKSNSMTLHFNKNYTILFFFLVTFFSFFIGIASVIRDTGLLAYSTVLGSTLLLFLFSYPIIKKSKILFLIMLYGFLARFSLSIYQAFIGKLPSGNNDAIAFEKGSWLISSAANNILDIFLINNGEFYYTFSAIIYYVFGRSQLLLQHLSSVLPGALLVLLAYKITQQLTNKEQPPLIAAGIVAFYPTLLQYSALTRRETLVYFLSAVSIFYFLKWLNCSNNKYIFVSAILLIGSSLFHSAMIFIGIVYIFFYVFYKPLIKKWSFSPIKILLIIMLIPIIIGISHNAIFSKIPDLSVDSLEDTVLRKSDSSRGRTGYLQEVSPNSIVEAVFQTPVRVTYFLFTPFPWQVKSFSDVYGFLLDTVPVYLLFIFSFKGLKSIKNRSKILYIFMILLLLSIAIPFSWGVANYGTAIRHRQKIVWIFIIIASIGWGKKQVSC